MNLGSVLSLVAGLLVVYCGFQIVRREHRHIDKSCSHMDIIDYGYKTVLVGMVIVVLSILGLI